MNTTNMNSEAVLVFTFDDAADLRAFADAVWNYAAIEPDAASLRVVVRADASLAKRIERIAIEHDGCRVIAGAVRGVERESDGTFTAVAFSASKNFRTRNGAERWLAKRSGR